MEIKPDIKICIEPIREEYNVLGEEYKEFIRLKRKIIELLETIGVVIEVSRGIDYELYLAIRGEKNERKNNE